MTWIRKPLGTTTDDGEWRLTFHVDGLSKPLEYVEMDEYKMADLNFWLTLYDPDSEEFIAFVDGDGRRCVASRDSQTDSQRRSRTTCTRLRFITCTTIFAASISRCAARPQWPQE